MIKSAEFSECKQYRYQLTRIWDENKPMAMCIGLNPSKANSEKNDSTINILIGTLTNLGYGGLHMLNLFSYISTDPKKLSSCADPIKLTDQWLMTTAYNVQDIIFCWGRFKQAKWRAKKVIEMFPSAKCFGKNADGSPWHPRAMTYAGIKNNQATLIKF